MHLGAEKNNFDIDAVKFGDLMVSNSPEDERNIGCMSQTLDSEKFYGSAHSKRPDSCGIIPDTFH